MMKLWVWLAIGMGIIALMVATVYYYGRGVMPVPTENLSPEQLEIFGVK